MPIERASDIIVECSSRATFRETNREGDIDRSRARGLIGRGRERDRARTRKREINVGARWIGEGRRQPARRMPLLAEVRFWDRLDSVESGQSSGRRYSSPRSRVPRFFRGLTSRLSRGLVAFFLRYFFVLFHLVFPLSLSISPRV